MARKFLYLIALFAVLVIAALFALRIWSTELTRFAFVPRTAFEKLPPLRPNAYANVNLWVSHPQANGTDPSRWTPDGASRDNGKAVVFFIHPTSYLARAHWNAPVTDTDSARRTDYYIRGMATPFNSQAQLWAPRYRQAAFGAFLTDKPEAQSALETAYLDVRDAFDTFLAAAPADAPIVLAGHSQGALHLMRLLQDRVAGTALAPRIAAAYVIGWPVSVQHDLPAMGLPACNAPDQAGCVVSWSSFAEPADPALVLEAYRARPALDGKPKGPEPVLCTNPLTGRTGGNAPASANTGTLHPTEKLDGGKLVKQAVPARCDATTGLLMIGDPPEIGPFVLPGNNYHIYDIPLFWQNLRSDVAHRAAAWGATHSKTAP
ncbi:DUF3089 domain-containing protein [Novosphingobium sp. SL115]|uniref:DUF3089 domain-containing protein n=1 Tax=Novosphingobium sp. SL115 TaxID=2995150 RepID=UPI002275F7C3|nr:DUF3089 domain-containing protein [Novosphingobium sp. SL115]MCY1671105.1 DUF3089 domain-containing protein [Novosphingobium sp. SL115]